ncbi:MAG TPA: class I SAM-dependent methyltransferase [Allosphingosinicella sp.]|nr:class I SAM-dependent methyltransferase [Allosphingosinicella sp.]
MADLLIHSMAEFRDIIMPALAAAEARQIVEIGAEFGGMTQLLAEFADHAGGRLTSIDPAPKPEFVEWLKGQSSVTHVPRLSLEAIPDQRDVDAWIIDGDHNWFTVYHECHAIGEAARRDGKPLLVFFHDVAWPSGRRDMYYAPDQIPAEFRHPYSEDAGAWPGCSELIPGRGFRGMGHFAWATHEGGPRNGVLTGIEDFLRDEAAAGRDYGFAEVPAVFGLGVLFAADAPWSEQVAQLVLPYHDNALLRRLEENRLANYLAVVDWQDRMAA